MLGHMGAVGAWAECLAVPGEGLARLRAAEAVEGRSETLVPNFRVQRRACVSSGRVRWRGECLKGWCGMGRIGVMD